MIFVLCSSHFPSCSFYPGRHVPVPYYSENGLPCSKLLPPSSSRGGRSKLWKTSVLTETETVRNSGVFTSARVKLKLVNASTLRMVTATGRPTGRPTAAAADRPTADRRGTRCAPQIAEPRSGSTRARRWRPDHGFWNTGRSFMCGGGILPVGSIFSWFRTM